LLSVLNPDLQGRVHELAIEWNDEDLREIMRRGGRALNVEFSDEIQEHTIAACFSNAGILQRLVLGTLDEVGVRETIVTRVRWRGAGAEY